MKAANWMTHSTYDSDDPCGDTGSRPPSTNTRPVRRAGCGCRTGTSRVSASRLGRHLELVADAAGIERFPCSECPKAGPWPSPTPSYPRAGVPPRGARLVPHGRLARATKTISVEAALDIELARVGMGRDEASFRLVFTSQFLPDDRPSSGSVRRAAAPHDLARERRALPQHVRHLDITELAPGQVPDTDAPRPRRPARTVGAPPASSRR